MKTKVFVELCKVSVSTTRKENDLGTHSNLRGNKKYVLNNILHKYIVMIIKLEKAERSMFCF